MKKIVVLGGGISGYGSAILAQEAGYEVFLSDGGKISDEYCEKLREWGITFEQGAHTEEMILDADEVIKSPGIPDSAPIVQKIRSNKIPVISEIEFAGRYLDGAKTICITGSNGKTTTTSLIYKILKDAGYSVTLAGNIGESFAYAVATEESDWYVLELSSFQLDGMSKFRSHISVLMNITPDHLDRYDNDFDKYAKSKMRIIRNQRSNDFFVYSADDEMIAKQIEEISPLRVKQLPFMAKAAVASLSGDAFLMDGAFTASVSNSIVEVYTDNLQIKGLHNTYNAMAAALAALAAGVEPAQVEKSIAEFGAVEHRMEVVDQINDIEWINDSKATNVDAVWYALEAMTRPTVWIAGGTDKGNDYQSLKELAKQKVHTLVCMGVDNSTLEREFKGVVPNIISTSSLDEAMSAANTAANEGDTVLLSPACASFDLFKNYEDRGTQFKEWVKSNA